MKKPRPEFQRLMEEFRKDRIQAMVVYDIDRMYRRVREAQLLVNWVYDFGLEEFVIASDTGALRIRTPFSAVGVPEPPADGQGAHG